MDRWPNGESHPEFESLTFLLRSFFQNQPKWMRSEENCLLRDLIVALEAFGSGHCLDCNQKRFQLILG